MTKGDKNVRLSARERAIARAYAIGRTQTQIARELGFNRGTVRSALQRPEVRDEVRRMMDMLDTEAVRAAIYAPFLADLLDRGPKK
jgi:DNA-binding NarL/FixJ family response regulator